MKTEALRTFEPRKTPVQKRSTVTVGAIAEATIQVLSAVRLDRLTTTRVADRAGVSVGTLYQYYPNERALLYAVLEAHSIKVVGSKNSNEEAIASRAVQITCWIGRFVVLSDTPGQCLAILCSRARSMRALRGVPCGRWRLIGACLVVPLGGLTVIVI